MVLRTSALLRGICIERLECRINCAVIMVTYTKDYDPALYDPMDFSTFETGSVRYAIQQSKDDYISSNGAVTDTIAFNVGSTANNMTDFGQPEGQGKTIQLDFGQLSIDRPVIIQAPKLQYPTKNYDYVTIKWQSSAFGVGSSGEGTDWSVFSIIPEVKGSVSLGGLHIFNGKAHQGAGIYAAGDFGLSIINCEIGPNGAQESPHDIGQGSEGAGIYARAVAAEGFAIGPNVVISGSLIHDNKTETNYYFVLPQSEMDKTLGWV